jgi:1-phosphatidylinositol phosphodiesterase
MHHGAYYLAANSDDVLGTSVQFLQEHPSETILMRVKQEHEPVDNTRSFAATFEYYRNQAAYTQFIWRGTTLPTLQQVRGKIVILDDFSGGWYGINWGSLEHRGQVGPGARPARAGQRE